MTTATAPAVKYVIVERKNMSGRYVALRGLAFGSQAEAEKHIKENFNERYAARLSVETRKVEADDTSERMTCQCCGRKYLARLGTVTLHGYERPGYGYQTASCMGAKQLPFENDHKFCDMLIASLAKRIVELKQSVKDTQNEKMECMFSITDYREERKMSRFHSRPSRMISFTRETMQAVTTETPEIAKGWAALYINSYDDAKAKQVASLKHSIKQTEDHKRDREAFRATWKHTHDYSKAAKEWHRIGGAK